ncbi:hypothetical protein SMD27_14680 [Dongia soli]|uniref:Uncharacterized protein n=1 Tax=Dongia soli TaxID=600628 RepID=A0ABU5EDV7_9PROT|nr:hypothetical protein [Dongia soli]MDY0884092.1 hypothetical protein [Dongia soli]
MEEKMTEAEAGRRHTLQDKAGQPKRRSRVFRRVKRLRLWLNRVLAAHSEVGDPAVFDNDVFPWIGNLERHWPAIRAEVEALVRSGEEIVRRHSP